MGEPLVHVLIVNWNGLEHLEECFDSLLAGTYPSARFVLVDNGSTDGSVEFVRERYGDDDRVEILECGSNLGWSGANNLGMERALAAGADYVFLLNNDTATAPDCLRRLADTAEARPEVAALAPKMLLYSDPTILNSVGLECSVIGSCWDLGLGRLDGPKWDTPRPVIGVCGGAFFIRTAALHRTGLLPDFEIYLDDLDLCLAMWNAGYEIWSCPDAVVRHKFGATMGQGKRARRKYYLNTRNRFRVLLRNYPASSALPVAAALARGEARALGRSLRDGAWWRVGAHLRAWGDAAAYLPAARAERRRRRAQNLEECRFWPLVRKDVLFFPGTEFPERGWYAPRPSPSGEEVRPIGRRAWLDWKGGRLRLTHVNCYPRLGATDLRVQVNGETIAALSTLDAEEARLDIPPGRIDIASNRIFDADETGERADFGGWLRVDEA